jgi:hypothetical protein
MLSAPSRSSPSVLSPLLDRLPWLLSLSFGTKDLKEGGYCQETNAGTVFFPSFLPLFLYSTRVYTPFYLTLDRYHFILFSNHSPFLYWT